MLTIYLEKLSSMATSRWAARVQAEPQVKLDQLGSISTVPD